MYDFFGVLVTLVALEVCQRVSSSWLQTNSITYQTFSLFCTIMFHFIDNQMQNNFLNPNPSAKSDAVQKPMSALFPSLEARLRAN